MRERTGDIVRAFARKRVLIIGDVMLDCYLKGRAERLCPEAPVPVVDVQDTICAPGGAGNTAANAAALGAHASLLGLMGEDAEGAALVDLLRDAGVDLSFCAPVAGRRTLSKKRVSSRSQVLLRVDEGDGHDAEGESLEAMLSSLRAAWDDHDVVVVSDYAYGTLSTAVISEIARLQRRRPRVLAADSKHLTAYREAGVTAVKPNYTGAVRLLGEDGGSADDRVESLERQGERILGLTGARIAAVTLDAEGALVFETGRAPYRTYARDVEAAKPAGAGDTFIVTLALALASGADTPEATELASASAGVAVCKDGTSTCSSAELLRTFAGNDKAVSDIRQVETLVSGFRDAGRRVVFTNGCFDILHRGHVTYLSQAKSLGDVLVVGVNSDESVRRLKGDGRPVNPLEDRLQVLEALSCVDLVVPFGQTTPDTLIAAVRPDVFVKGGDYSEEQLPEAALVRRLGGDIRILPFLPQRSTTGLIDRILSQQRVTTDER